MLFRRLDHGDLATVHRELLSLRLLVFPKHQKRISKITSVYQLLKLTKIQKFEPASLAYDA